MKLQLITLVEQAVRSTLARSDADPIDLPEIQLEVPRNPAHGDFSTNIAMILAKRLGKPPRDIASNIIENLELTGVLQNAELAGPGFINLRIATNAFTQSVAQVISAGERYGQSDIGAGRSIQIEFVSANPTGPLHVGHGRGAAYGAVLANIFRALGYTVSCEYYVNDAGRQMDILAVSVLLRYLEQDGASVDFPSNAYQGAYITDIARALRKNSDERIACPSDDLMSPTIDQNDPELAIDQLIARAKSALGAAHYSEVHQFARDHILAGIKSDLLAFGVEFDNWFAESSLADAGRIDELVASLQVSSHIYTKDGALWFKSTAFGDEKDRVVVRENGSPTYFASDIAYHADKYLRGFEHLINIWGADHHGYITRVKAAIDAIGCSSERLEVLLVQFAALFRDGEKVAMSTRSGEFVTLADLVADVGRDAARFFYITRRADQHLDFDLDLAKAQNNENPVFYVQYAHARICGVFKKLEEAGYYFDLELGLRSTELLDHEKEKQLIMHLLRYPEVVETAVRDREPHQITTYLRDLAASLHAYHGSDQKIICEDAQLRNARLVLNRGAKQVLANGLELLGVSAPEVM
ncbi:MAG: arginyl-tRNA synthetase [Gammaproteobacteria bacterium]